MSAQSTILTLAATLTGLINELPKSGGISRMRSGFETFRDLLVGNEDLGATDELPIGPAADDPEGKNPVTRHMLRVMRLELDLFRRSVVRQGGNSKMSTGAASCVTQIDRLLNPPAASDSKPATDHGPAPKRK